MERYLLRMVVVLAVWLAAVSVASAQTAVEYIHTDALGTPVAVTNSAGAVIERSVYEPYGQLINRPLTDGPGFTGHVQDAATGLTYMQQRYYDPQVGVFLSVDPVAAHGNPVTMFNRYRYANNNPYTYNDPDGRMIQAPWSEQRPSDGLPNLYGNPCGVPICLAAGDGGSSKETKSPEERQEGLNQSRLTKYADPERIASIVDSNDGGWLGSAARAMEKSPERYVYTLDLGWVDLAHAVGSFNFFKDLPGLGEMIGNYGNENLDLIKGRSSAWMPEDVSGHRIGREAQLVWYYPGMSGQSSGQLIEMRVQSHKPLSRDDAARLLLGK